MIAKSGGGNEAAGTTTAGGALDYWMANSPQAWTMVAELED